MALNVNYSAEEMAARLNGGVLPQNNTQREVDVNLYSPKLSDAKTNDGTYSSFIMFVPDINNAESYVKKKVTWLKKSMQEKSAFPVDNPWSIGETNNPINDTFYAMLNTNVERIVKMAKACINTKDMCYAKVQIIKDDNRPELQGRIMVMPFSKQIMDKINEETKGSDTHKAINPFNAWYGRLFNLKITQGAMYPTYEKSSFFDNPDWKAGIRYMDANNNWHISCPEDANNPEAIKNLFNYIVNNSPDLSAYTYKPWDEATNKKVMETLDAIIKNAQSGGVATPAEVAFGQTTNAPVFTGVNQAPMQNVTQQYAQAAPAAAPNFGAVQTTPQYGVSEAASAPTFSGFGAPQPQQPTAPTFGAGFGGPTAPTAPQVTGVTMPTMNAPTAPVQAAPQPEAAPEATPASTSPFGNVDNWMSKL